MEYNEKHNITPKTIIKEVRNVLEITSKEKVEEKYYYTCVGIRSSDWRCFGALYAA